MGKLRGRETRQVLELILWRATGHVKTYNRNYFRIRYVWLPLVLTTHTRNVSCHVPRLPLSWEVGDGNRVILKCHRIVLNSVKINIVFLH